MFDQYVKLNDCETLLGKVTGAVCTLVIIVGLCLLTGCGTVSIETDSDYEYTGWNDASDSAYGPFGLKPISHTLFTVAKKEK